MMQAYEELDIRSSTAASLSARAREQVALLKIDRFYRTVRTAIRVGGHCFAAWCLYLSVESVAGKTTAFSVGLSFLWDVRLGLAFSVAGSAILWATAERWLRHRKVEFMQGRIRGLELKIDPKRSTSELTTKGGTNPKDRE
jgi:hypothetical protein